MSDVCPGCGVDSITPHIAGCPTVADRPLTAGSERLSAEVIPCSDEFESRAEIIKADPGIVALVEFAEAYQYGWHGAGVSPKACAALDAWRTGQ